MDEQKRRATNIFILKLFGVIFALMCVGFVIAWFVKSQQVAEHERKLSIKHFRDSAAASRRYLERERIQFLHDSLMKNDIGYRDSVTKADETKKALLLVSRIEEPEKHISAGSKTEIVAKQGYYYGLVELENNSLLPLTTATVEVQQFVKSADGKFSSEAQSFVVKNIQPGRIYSKEVLVASARNNSQPSVIARIAEVEFDTTARKNLRKSHSAAFSRLKN